MKNESRRERASTPTLLVGNVPSLPPNSDELECVAVQNSVVTWSVLQRHGFSMIFPIPQCPYVILCSSEKTVHRIGLFVKAGHE